VAQTIEIVRFKLAPTTDPNEFLRQNKAMEVDFIMKQPGIISRETGLSDDGEVVVVLHWERPEDAQASMNKFVAAPQTAAFTALLDMTSFTMKHFLKA
jgi:hypothetical protein